VLGWFLAGAFMAAAVPTVVLGVQDARAAARRRVCPVCSGRELTRTNWIRWSGTRDDGSRCGGAYTVYRCACGEELFEELGLSPMTRSQYDAWARALAGPRRPLPPATAHHRR
jgi:hypothetical protein